MPRYKKIGNYRFGQLKIVVKDGIREPVRILKKGKTPGEYKVLFLNLNNDIKESVANSNLKEPLKPEMDTTEAERAFRAKELKHRASYQDSDTDTDTEDEYSNKPLSKSDDTISKSTSTKTTTRSSRTIKKNNRYDPALYDDDSPDHWDGHIQSGKISRENRIENDKYNNHEFCQKCYYVKHSKNIKSSACVVDGLPHVWVLGQTEAEQIDQYVEDRAIIEDYKRYKNITSTGYAEDGFVENDYLDKDGDYEDDSESADSSVYEEEEEEEEDYEIENELVMEDYDYESAEEKEESVSESEAEAESEAEEEEKGLKKEASDALENYKNIKTDKSLVQKKYGRKYGTYTRSKSIEHKEKFNPEQEASAVMRRKRKSNSSALSNAYAYAYESLAEAKPEKRTRMRLVEDVEENSNRLYPLLYCKLEWAHKMHTSGFMPIEHYENIEKSVYEDMMVSVYS